MSRAFQFVCERLDASRRSRRTPLQDDETLLRALIDLLRRTDIPLDDDPGLRTFVADQLEMACFMTPQERRRIRGEQRREAAALARRSQIAFIAKRDNVSAVEAKQKIADSESTTVEAITQTLKPTRITGKH